MEQKYLPVGVLEEISKISQNSQGRHRAGVLLFHSYSLEYLIKQKPKVKVTRSTLSKKRPQNRDFLHKYFPVNFEKIVNMTFNTYCLWNNVKERARYLEFSYVFFISKCSSLHQNNSNTPEEHHKVVNWEKLATQNKIFWPSILFRSSRPEVFSKKCVFKNFIKLTGKSLCRSVF